MSQATLSERPYVNSNLFSGHYLDERVRERDEWDCDEAAREAMEELQSLYELESGLVDGYKEDPLIDNWIDEVLDILGFGTNVETTLRSMAIVFAAIESSHTGEPVDVQTLLNEARAVAAAPSQ